MRLLLGAGAVAGPAPRESPTHLSPTSHPPITREPPSNQQTSLGTWPKHMSPRRRQSRGTCTQRPSALLPCLQPLGGKRAAFGIQSPKLCTRPAALNLRACLDGPHYCPACAPQNGKTCRCLDIHGALNNHPHASRLLGTGAAAGHVPSHLDCRVLNSSTLAADCMCMRHSPLGVVRLAAWPGGRKLPACPCGPVSLHDARTRHYPATANH